MSNINSNNKTQTDKIENSVESNKFVKNSFKKEDTTQSVNSGSQFQSDKNNNIKFYKKIKIKILNIFKINFKFTILDMTLIGFFVGLYLVLSYLSSVIPNMPQGGTLDLKFIPILVLVLLRPYGTAFLTAILGALLEITFSSKFIVTPVQYLLDYFFPAIAATFAVFFKFNPKNIKLVRTYILYFLFITVPMFLIYVCHVISGTVYFSEYRWSNYLPFTYSLVYNLIYMGINYGIYLAVMYWILLGLMPLSKS